MVLTRFYVFLVFAVFVMLCIFLCIHSSLAATVWEVGQVRLVEKLDVVPSSQTLLITDLHLRPFLVDYSTPNAPWSDKFLSENIPGGAVFTDVELELKETRLVYPLSNYSISSFLNEYRTREMYAVSDIPQELRDLIILPEVGKYD